jgi:hypothetical protein
MSFYRFGPPRVRNRSTGGGPCRAICADEDRDTQQAESEESLQRAVLGGVKRFCQFGNESAQLVAGDAGEDRMGQRRAGLLDRRKSESARPVTV